MNLEKTFAYFTHHSESITQWLCLATMLLVAAVVARALFGKRGEGGSDGVLVASASPEVQGALTKIIDQVSKLENLGGGLGAGAGDADARVHALTAELKNRDEEITRLKSASASDPAGAGAEPAPLSPEDVGLASRLKELEAKLAEYEILEDDIADLSLYKEENARLKDELEQLKSAPAPAPVVAAPAPEVAEAPAPLAAAPSAPAPEVATEEPAPIQTPSAPVSAVSAAAASAAEAASALLDDFGDAARAPAEPVDTASATPTPESTPVTEVSEDASLAAASTDSASALDVDVAAGIEEAAPVPPAVESAPVVGAAPIATSAAALEADGTSAPNAESSSVPEADDLFAEFSVSAPEEGADLDTEKMLAEMAALSADETISGANALEESIDIDKMALEAHSGKS